jgi:hypothetical protein
MEFNRLIAMAKNKSKKIIKVQVPMDEDLLERIDATAGIVAESRAAFIRAACQQRLKNFEAKERDRLYMEGIKGTRKILTGLRARPNCSPNGCLKKNGNHYVRRECRGDQAFTAARVWKWLSRQQAAENPAHSD